MQVTLKLCTNIEPRHGGRLDMSSLLWTSGTAGRPWEYTGPASLLKSALQKNVRRGRAEEAVRRASAQTLHHMPQPAPGSSPHQFCFAKEPGTWLTAAVRTNFICGACCLSSPCRSMACRCAQRLLQSEPGELLRRAIVISVEVTSIPDTVKRLRNVSWPPPELLQSAISGTIIH